MARTGPDPPRRPTAARFVAEGARVLLVARNAERLQQTCEEIGSDRCHYRAADICDGDEVAACVRHAEEELGAADVSARSALQVSNGVERRDGLGTENLAFAPKNKNPSVCHARW